MSPGEAVTRWTVRAALACYALIPVVWLSARPAQGTRLSGAVRVLWTIGCALFLAHVVAAFQFYHHWSHADAWRETALRTAELTGRASGTGLWLNYLFAAVWAADVLYWWVGGLARYRRRRRRIAAALHAFMLFMAFNATVVFAVGAVRWSALAALTLLLVLFAVRRVRRVPAAVVV